MPPQDRSASETVDQNPSSSAKVPADGAMSRSLKDVVSGSEPPGAALGESRDTNQSFDRNYAPESNALGNETHAHDGPCPESCAEHALRSPCDAAKSRAADDDATNISSSNSSAKPLSLDGKSVASVTTFALDEKESIRPDDSASIRAVEEDRDEVFTPPDSVAAGSRVGSDNGIGRAFRDQLNEISVIGVPSQRGITPYGRNVQIMSNNGAAQSTPGLLMTLPISATKDQNAISQIQPIPDEKLLEALRSPRDRLFVLKLEQDVLDFLRNAGEKELDVPNCNAFYRMLAHRFADYYYLGHVVDPITSAVKITKTPYSRIPPPLSSLLPSSLTSGPDTPPIMVPARKIMRRGESGGTPSSANTTANSDGPSKAASEVGADSGSDAGQGARKLTREEREAKYKEVRQRIFGSAEDGDVGEPAQNESKDMSRSSSSAGRRNRMKHRSKEDDEFQARSQFYYYPVHYGAPGFPSDAQPMYYGPPTSDVNPSMQPASSYPAIPQSGSQDHFAWQYQQFSSAPGHSNAASYASPVPVNYDLAQDFQEMSFQPGGVPNRTPKMSNPALVALPDGFRPQPQGTSQAWQTSGHMPFQIAPQGYDNRPVLTAQNPYPYGQLPNPSVGNDRDQHPLPGSFNRQQFNPQSQAFVPSVSVPATRGPPGFAPPGQSPQMGNASYFNMPTYHHHQPLRPGQSVPHTQLGRSPGSVAFAKSQYQCGPHPLFPPAPVAHHQGPRADAAGNHSSIAKWGSPAHLPPKPPAPIPHNQNYACPPPSRVPSEPPPQQSQDVTYPIPSIIGAGNGARAVK